MSDHVLISPGQYAVSSALRNSSALAHCTRVDTTDDGHLAIIRNWPGLSTGEELLWQVLAWLNGADTVPDLEVLTAHLDASNLAAALDALAAGSGVTR